MTQEMQKGKHQLGALTGANKRDHFYELHYQTGEIARLYILADGIFRYYLDPTKHFDDNHAAFIDFSEFDHSAFEESQARATSDSLIIKAGNYQLIFQQRPSIMSVFDDNLHRTRFVQGQPLLLGDSQTTEVLKQNKNEFYFGGGLQNGSFSHKGKRLNIKRDHITGNGGVITQVPFFWSNAGFGELRNTLRPGVYDFGADEGRSISLTHDTALFDNIYILADSPSELIQKYYDLTGKPIMLPKYALELGHVGNFLTTYWKPAAAKERNADSFEDGSYYVRTKNPDEAAGRASLNGEETFQFSARAMIDRYAANHFHLGWMVPNYGQEADEAALATFNDYANNQNVASGTWMGQAAGKPVAGTSFVQTNTPFSRAILKDHAELKKLLDRKRPLILADTGVAGSQHQTVLAYGSPSGDWDNIPTQVAGFLGAGLSGQPLVGASVDGTAGGGNAQMAIRDLEWKAFTPILFYISDQGSYSKTPFAYNAKMTRINRAYLALRNRMKNYLYSLMYEAQTGKPIMRPLFLEFPHEQVNYLPQVGHEFMLGENLLIAPIYNGREDANSNSRKDNLYLPDHRTLWVDLFTGEKFVGGRVYNNLSYPLWHLPVFVRGGAIFDQGDRNYVFYPQGKSSIVSYEDGGKTDYMHNHAVTRITSELADSTLKIQIDPKMGNYSGMKTEGPTRLSILTDGYPDSVQLKINDQTIDLQEYGTIDAFNHAKEGFFYNTNFSWLTEFDQYQPEKQKALQIKLASRDLTDTKIELVIRNFNYGSSTLVHAITDSALRSPKQPTIEPEKTSAHSLTVSWPQVTDEVQIEINGLLYDRIKGKTFTFHELMPHTRYLMRLRYVAGNKVSEWSDPFGAITKHQQLDYAVKDIRVDSSLPSKDEFPLAYLTDLKTASEWQTAKSVSDDEPLVLTFTFAEAEKLSRMVYVPRLIDKLGDPLEVAIETSADGENFTPYGERIVWKADNKNKVIGLRNLTAKAIRLRVFKSEGDCVSAREIMFFRAK